MLKATQAMLTATRSCLFAFADNFIWGLSMNTRNLKGTVALGSLTATVALLAGLSSASAQSAPGAGSFPQSFLIPGTNTSLSIYGVIKSSWRDNIGAQHDSDNGSPFGGRNGRLHLNQLALQGPGAAGGNTATDPERATIHGGLR